MRTPHTERHHVVIVGAGFAGLETARSLRSTDVDVTIVDQHTVHTFQPLLYQVATAALDPSSVSRQVRGLLRGRRGQRFRLGRVVDLDLEGRRVVLDDGGSVAYDSLVLALGAVYGDLGVPGVRRHAFALKTLHEAVALRSHLLRQLELAAHHPHDEGLRTVVVAGAGPTGVEMAGALAELLRAHRAETPELRGHPMRVVLVEPTDRVLASYGAGSRAYTERTLRRLGVEVRLGTAVRRAHGDRVELSDGTTLDAHTLVWAAGVRAHPLVERLGVDLGPGWRVPVGADLALPERPEVFVVGDLAGRVAGAAPHPQVAQAAIQMGKHVGRVIQARLAGRSARPFRYGDRGQMAIVARGAGVVEIAPRLGGARIRGVLGWLAWLAVHVAFLPGHQQRLTAATTWLRNAVTAEREARALLAVDRDAHDAGWATPASDAVASQGVDRAA